MNTYLSRVRATIFFARLQFVVGLAILQGISGPEGRAETGGEQRVYAVQDQAGK